ncbi:MAG: ABC transporter ATP-binding protein [Bacillota bacterium]|nr:ABC transporter ATP-binding protein [Bacillota bacterium]REJ36374.1 MAG: ABC transporter ATP-binding protein [Bacillota bacterium]
MSETRSKAPAGAAAEATAVQAAAGEPILTLEDVHVSYGNIRAVRGISMEVRRGEIVTLIGANGAGKTTTLRAISRLVPIAQGRITFRGQDLARFPAHEVVRLGICHVPEGRGVFANLTVRENLLLATYSRRGKGDIEQDLERVYSVFPRLAERRNQYAGTLSGGEQQMLAVGRALMTGGELMLLDEPSMGLAPILVEEIFRILVEINRQGTTLLLVEQNARMALQVAHRAYVLETGAITVSGPAKDLLDDPRVREAYLGA